MNKFKNISYFMDKLDYIHDIFESEKFKNFRKTKVEILDIIINKRSKIRGILSQIVNDMNDIYNDYLAKHLVIKNEEFSIYLKNNKNINITAHPLLVLSNKNRVFIYIKSSINSVNFEVYNSPITYKRTYKSNNVDMYGEGYVVIDFLYKNKLIDLHECDVELRLVDNNFKITEIQTFTVLDYIVEDSEIIEFSKYIDNSISLLFK